MVRVSKKSVKRANQFFRKWHRRFGIIAAFFLVFLSITGVALNHTDSLTLGHQPITNTWLLDHYGINAPKDIRFFHDNNLKLTDRYVWLDKQLLL